jgi:hypothetical protein
MQKHSKIGASGAKRWMTCPGSVRLCDGVANRTSEFAAEGTAAHALAEQCFQLKVPTANGFIGTAIEGFIVNSDMAEAVNVYLKADLDDSQQGDEIEYEVKFQLSEIHTGLYGTADRVRYRPSDRSLRITDYKHGAGVPVEVDWNPQLLYYAIGAAWRLGNRGVSKVELEIVQPRCPHPGGPVRMWETDIIELIEFADDLKHAALATEKPDAPLIPGDHCRWCPAAGFCPALAKKALKSAQQDFSAELPYSPGDLAEALESVPMVRQWLKSIEQFALEEALAGRIPPGNKLVEKRATRKWRDDEKAATALLEEFGMSEDDVFEPRSLRSPAQIEEKYGKKNKGDLAELITSETSGVTLVPLSDRRSAVAKSTAADDFGAAVEQ